MYERVLVTIDGSDFADEAIECAQELAAAFDSKVLLLDVLPRHKGPAAYNIEAARLADCRDACAHLRAAKARLNQAGVTDVEMVEVVGSSPGRKIVSTARELDCDLVVMSTHARSALGRALRGSVADYVVRHLLGVPVMLVHAQNGRAA